MNVVEIVFPKGFEVKIVQDQGLLEVKDMMTGEVHRIFVDVQRSAEASRFGFIETSTNLEIALAAVRFREPTIQIIEKQT